MKVSNKKLLSLLVVAAMVLSMVPSFALPASATTDAPETPKVTPGQANLPDGIQEIIDAAPANTDANIESHIAAGTCPMCNGTGITWTAATGAVSGSGHYYYALAEGETATTYTVAQTVFTLDGSDKQCIAVKSGVTIHNTEGNTVNMSGNGNTLSIMGAGNFTDATGTADTGMMYLQGGSSSSKNTVNLFGGTFVHTTAQAASSANSPSAVVRICATYVTVNMYNGVTVGPAAIDTTTWKHNVRVDKGTFNMYGGMIQNGVSQKNGVSGNVTISDSGTMKMYGGTIKDGRYKGETCVGGNVLVGGYKQGVTSSGVGHFYMYGGLMTGGASKNGGNGGGNVANYNGGGKMHLLGGIIENGTATWGGGNVAVQSGATANRNLIGGTVLIRNGSANSNGFGANVSVQKGKRLDMTGGFIEGGTKASTKYKGGGIGILDSADFYMSGGTISGCKGVNGGAIYASAGTSSDRTNVNISGTAMLDGNTSSNSGGTIFLGSGYVTLTMSGGTIQNGNTTGYNAGAVYISKGSTMNMTDGTITKCTAAVKAGAVYLAAGGTFTMTGGEISECTIGADGGGAIYLAAGTEETASVATIGGTAVLKNNSTTGNGGAVYLAGAYNTLNMTGGTIELCHAKNGGAIYCAASSSCAISGGTISECYTTDDGGAVFLASGTKDAPTTVNISGTALLEKNHAVSEGGAVHVAGANAPVTVSGGTIRNNYTTGTSGAGGNISGTSKSVINISGGTIHGGYNNAEGGGGSWGGNIRSWEGTVNISGGYIYDGYAKSGTNKYAANIGVLGSGATATLNISGGHIGGDIYYDNALVISGAPEIRYSGLKLPDGTIAPKGEYSALRVDKGEGVDISNLAPEAYIEITGDVGDVFTAAHENAANVAGCFVPVTTANFVELQADNTLKIVKKAAGIVADGAESWFSSFNKALEAYYAEDGAANGKVITLKSAATATLAGDVYIDANGNAVAASGEGILYALDSSNDDYEGAATWTVTGNVTVKDEAEANGKRYISLKTGENTYSAHRVDMKLTAVSLRTNKAGMYYKAEIKCDDTLAGRVNGYGVVLSTNDMPDNEFMFENSDKYTMFDELTMDANHSAKTTSGSVFGVIKNPEETDRTAEVNADYMNMKVYANLYLAVDRNGDNAFGSESFFMSDNKNYNKTAVEGEKFPGVAFSLMDVLKGVNDNWGLYNDTQKKLVKDTIAEWENWLPDGAFDTELPNLVG